MKMLLSLMDKGLSAATKESKIGIIGRYSKETLYYIMLLGLYDNLRNSECFTLKQKLIQDYGLDIKVLILVLTNLARCQGIIGNQKYICVKKYSVKYSVDNQINITIESPYLHALLNYATQQYGAKTETPYQDIVKFLTAKL